MVGFMAKQGQTGLARTGMMIASDIKIHSGTATTASFALFLMGSVDSEVELAA